MSKQIALIAQLLLSGILPTKLVVVNSFSTTSFINLVRQRSNVSLKSETIKHESVKTPMQEDSSAAKPFANFDYEAHWYPVVWARDLEVNDPTKVTVFDVDYVVSKTSDGEVICLHDKCSHKGAALSQGRVSSNGKNFQCAYHGWSYDGKSGECAEIPQIATADGSSAKIPSRSRANAVPAQIHQEMVWLFPGGGLEEALQAPPPPTVAEVETNGFKLGQYVRDFPVDWPIVVSNVFDPDHGMFAHQASTFDMYTASKEFPIELEQDYPNEGRGWIMKSKVDSRDKMKQVDAKLRETKDPSKKKNKKKKKGDERELWASSYFYAPFHLQLKRVDKETGSTNFVSTFYICPVGVGRVRLMAAQGSKMSIPRWITKVFTDNFLDQDTYLLATQQKNILTAEAKEVEELMKMDPSKIKSQTMKTRRKMFCLTSPTEKVGARLEQFWDATLLRVPNRVERLLQLNAAGAFATTPPREVVLDRKRQQLDICKDSQGVVKNCQTISKYSKLVGITTVAAKVLGKTPKIISSPTGMAVTLGLCYLASFMASKLEREYYFKYTDDYRKKDLTKIPEKIWLDKD
jgi:phenylpropionate dioxygenase-like ring-hydroxylating dioxygenase large terminal subunit